MKMYGGKDDIVKAVVSLLKIKSLVTLAATFVFACMLLKQMEIPKYFETVYTVIVSFFFGSQYGKHGDGSDHRCNGWEKGEADEHRSDEKE